MKIELQEDIRDIFSIFHDGVISCAKSKAHGLVLEIEIQYLAERVQSGFSVFTVVLNGFRNAEFTTWPHDAEMAPEKITDISRIFEPKLEILESSNKDNGIRVVCNQHSGDYHYCGGELFFVTDTAEVYDESKKLYSIDELDKICKGYWDEWAGKA